QDRYGRNHDEDQEYRGVARLVCIHGAYRRDQGCHHQGMDHDVADTDAGTHNKLMQHVDALRSTSWRSMSHRSGPAPLPVSFTSGSPVGLKESFDNREKTECLHCRTLIMGS